MTKRKERMLDDFPDMPWIGQYILGGEDGHTPVPCYSLSEWGKWLGEPEHRSLWLTGNDVKWVSTVFLGLDHRHFGGGPPLVFETMAFQHEGRTTRFWDDVERPVPETLCQERYSSWDDAEIGHKAAVRKYLVNPKTRVKVDEVLDERRAQGGHGSRAGGAEIRDRPRDSAGGDA